MKPVLTTDEYEILCEYGLWMNALYSKELTPISQEQEQFCKNLKSETPPTEKYARIFWTYLQRKKILSTENLSNYKVLIKDDREDWKKIRKMKF